MDKNEIFFEDIHKATQQCPYLSWDSVNLNYIMHYHEEMEIVYVAEGEIAVTGERKSVTAKQGDICLFMPMEIHNITTPAQSCCWVIKAVPFSGDGWNLFHLRPVSNVLHRDEPMHAVISERIAQIRHEILRSPALGNLAAVLAMGEIQYRILRDMDCTILDLKERDRNSRYAELLTRINAFLETHYADTITLSEISADCHMSTYYFAHSIKEAAQLSFGEYLTQFRLGKAIEKMRQTSLPLTVIALNCGFGSVRSFNRAFLRYYHTTPSRFRKTDDSNS